MNLPRITDSFVCVDDCPVCLGSGHVCEEHPDKAWGEGDGCCGAPGMPCLHTRCRFANDVKIERPSVFDPDGDDHLKWPCGISVRVHAGEPRVRYYVDELRALHRTTLLNMQVNAENDRTGVSFHVEHGGI